MADQHIKIADAAARAQYVVGSTAQSAFTIPFVFFELTDILVYKGSQKLTYGADYQVTGASIVGGFTGGTVTLTTAAKNTTVTLVREIKLERTTDFPESGKFNIRSLNSQLDRHVAMVQQLRETMARAAILDATSPIGSIVIEPPIAGKFLQYDATGTRIISADANTAGGIGGIPAVGVGKAFQILRANAAEDGYELSDELRATDWYLRYLDDTFSGPRPILWTGRELNAPRTGAMGGFGWLAPDNDGEEKQIALIYAALDSLADGANTASLHIILKQFGADTVVFDFADPIVARRPLNVRVSQTGPAAAGAILRLINDRTSGALVNDVADLRAQFRNQLNQITGFGSFSFVCEDPTLGSEDYYASLFLYRGGVGKTRWRFRDGIHHPDLANKGDGTVNGKGLFINNTPIESGMMVRAWVRCDSAGAIVASHNVSSVSVLGTGRRRVNFTNAFANANYGFGFGLIEAAAANQSVGVENGTSPAAGSVDVATRNSAGTLTDIAFSGLFTSTESGAPGAQAPAANIFDLLAEDGTAMTTEGADQLVIDT